MKQKKFDENHIGPSNNQDNIAKKLSEEIFDALIRTPGTEFEKIRYLSSLHRAKYLTVMKGVINFYLQEHDIGK